MCACTSLCGTSRVGHGMLAAVVFHRPGMFFAKKKKKKYKKNSRAGLPHSVLSFMEKGAVVQMGADSTHHSGILNMIGWAENVSQERWAVFLPWLQRTSVKPRAGRSKPLVSHSQRGSQCFPLDGPAGIFLSLQWNVPCCRFNGVHSAASVPAPTSTLYCRSGGAWTKHPPDDTSVCCCRALWEDNWTDG